MDSGAEFSKCCVAVAVQVYRVLVNGTLPTIYRTIQYNILKKATKLPRYQHQSMVEHFQVQYFIKNLRRRYNQSEERIR